MPFSQLSSQLRLDMGSLGPKLQPSPGSASSLPTAAAPSSRTQAHLGVSDPENDSVIAHRSPHLGSGSLLSGRSPSTGNPYRSRRGWQWTLVCVPSFWALGAAGYPAKGAGRSQPSPRLAARWAGRPPSQDAGP